ncbi:class I mannose-6-phosphate isomerase [Kaistia terrae]|uniref:Class I mannose-6-phosphate isomerase n=1 Tax=Kaistia terrae TaxID=537017 RepID=A0ABW0PPT3_9HYPH|nr:class I mannose-6-phosphate isomerase [Kaistia terrae]MCX5577886.1 class I mannose-6-phosphate isomerase [Kaistia terrae]
MTIEYASMQVVRKPWGKHDLRPWNDTRDDGAPVGEIWFQRQPSSAGEPELLLKLLFTSQPLSIQVHPDDAYAHTMGEPHGKTEAWYILAAEPGAAVAVGLKRELSPDALRAAIEDGSIADLVQWHPVHAGDAVFIPAGTIHAVGPGLVLAEIQQRSDVTFRLFDYGRKRELHVDAGVAVAHAGPPGPQQAPRALGDNRTLLVVNPYFVLERIALPPNTTRVLNASCETWFLGLEGDATLGANVVGIGKAVFLDHERCTLRSGERGLTALCAYLGPESHRNLLEAPDQTLSDSTFPHRTARRIGASISNSDGTATAFPRSKEVYS